MDSDFVNIDENKRSLENQVLASRASRYLDLMKQLTRLADENRCLLDEFSPFPGSIALEAVLRARAKIQAFSELNGEVKEKVDRVEFVRAQPSLDDEIAPPTQLPQTLAEAVLSLELSGLVRVAQLRQGRVQARALALMIRFPGFTSRNKKQLQRLIKSRIEKETVLRSTWQEKRRESPVEVANTIDAFFSAELKHSEQQYLESETKILAEETILVKQRRILAGLVVFQAALARSLRRKLCRQVEGNMGILTDLKQLAGELRSLPKLPPLVRWRPEARLALNPLVSAIRAATQRKQLAGLRALELAQIAPHKLRAS